MSRSGLVPVRDAADHIGGSARREGRPDKTDRHSPPPSAGGRPPGSAGHGQPWRGGSATVRAMGMSFSMIAVPAADAGDIADRLGWQLGAAEITFDDAISWSRAPGPVAGERNGSGLVIDAGGAIALQDREL